MRELIIKTNYEVLLSHFVDSMSKWDVFVAPHLHRYFDETFGITEEDKKHLDAYSKKRNEYDWDEQSPLFDWAYARFPDNERYNGLKTHILYFEQRKSKDGCHTFKEILLSRLNDINELLSSDFEIFKQKEKIDDVVAKMTQLVEYEARNESPLVAYLACSMNTSTQGGANGANIYAEVPLESHTQWVNEYVSELLIHEYFHKAFSPHIYFEKLGGIFNWENDDIFPDPMSLFFEEVLVYSSSSVYISGEDPKKKLSKYPPESYNDKHYTLWKTIDRFYQLIADYLDGKIAMDKTRQEILTLCAKVVEEFKQQKSHGVSGGRNL